MLTGIGFIGDAQTAGDIAQFARENSAVLIAALSPPWLGLTILSALVASAWWLGGRIIRERLIAEKHIAPVLELIDYHYRLRQHLDAKLAASEIEIALAVYSSSVKGLNDGELPISNASQPLVNYHPVLAKLTVPSLIGLGEIGDLDLNNPEPKIRTDPPIGHSMRSTHVFDPASNQSYIKAHGANVYLLTRALGRIQQKIRTNDDKQG